MKGKPQLLKLVKSTKEIVTSKPEKASVAAKKPTKGSTR